MRRNLNHVKHLLDLVQAHADEEGISMIDLLPKWEASSGNPEVSLLEPELIYLVNRCADVGYLAVNGGHSVQLTWAGHDYLDSVTVKPLA